MTPLSHILVATDFSEGDRPRCGSRRAPSA